MMLGGRVLSILKMALTAGAISIGLIGCSSPRQAADENPSLVGYRLIDEGRSDAAIEHFQSLVDQDPASDEYRRGLSSAYALRGGFRVQNLVKPMREIDSANHLKDDLEDMIEFDSKSNSKVLTEFRSLLMMQTQVMVFLKSLHEIRSPTADQVEDLKTAVATLLPMKQVTQGDYLYMAVLDALILRFQIQNSQSEPIGQLSCEDWLQFGQKSLLKVANQYGQILTNLMAAKPSQKEEYQKQISMLEDASLKTSELTTTSLATLSLLKYASELEDIRILSANPQCGE